MQQPLGRIMEEGNCTRCDGEITLDDFESDTCPECDRFVVGICMECDEAIPYDCDDCPECGLDGPVAYRWFRLKYEADIIKARDGDDPIHLANLLFKAWYDAGSLPDNYVMCEVMLELLEVYRLHEMYERLIFQLCFNYGDYERGSPDEAQEALDLVRKIGREDLELYCYERIDLFNKRVYHKDSPEDIVVRKEELRTKIAEGKLQRFDPDLAPDMWTVNE
jgi:predicted RNA-binding Zn-ribbon protein involved in translation (DUF1610 family)